MRDNFQIDRYIRIGRAFDFLLRRVEKDELKKKALYAFAGFVHLYSIPVDEVEHCIDVAKAFATSDYICFTVALYHDSIEDHYVEEKHLMSHCNDIRRALDAITRREGEVYKNYIMRCKENDIARRVKLADLISNLRRCNDDDVKYASLKKRYTAAVNCLSCA